METGPALFGLHYHLAKLRGDLGHPGFADWARKLRLFEDAEPCSLLAKILSPEDAVSALQGEREPRLRSHALSALGEAYSLSHASNDGKGKRDYGRYLRKLKPDANLDALETEPHPRMYLLDGAADDTLALGKYSFTWGDCSVDDGVSRVSATGAGPAKEKFHYFAERADPRNWSKYSNTTFALTYAAEETTNAFRNPPRDRRFGGRSGKTWKGKLYEGARLEILAGEDITLFRDILSIDFRVSSPRRRPKRKASNDEALTTNGTLTLEYSLYECLTSTILGFENEGGLDVDSGKGGVRRKDGAVTVHADKGIRFSDAAAFSEVLNLVAFPFLTYWISDLILLTLEQ